MASKSKTDPPPEDVETSRRKILNSVVESLGKSCENESWGLMVEAAEDYQKTCFKLKHAVLPEVNCFSREEKIVLAKVSTALFFKYSGLHQLSTVEGLKSGASQQTIDAKKIHSALESFTKGTMTLAELESGLKDCLNVPPPSCPGEASGGAEAAIKEKMSLRSFLHMPDDEYIAALEDVMNKKSGTLLVRKDVLPGYKYLNITIEKIELKDAETYFDPFITVSVKSLAAEDVEESQDTPTATDREVSAVIFDATVQIQRPLEEIPGGSAIFFEFKHHKSKKDVTSTKCFSFMEMDEIKPGRTYLEIYKKPTDFRRKKLSLLSARALYLHLNLSIDKP